MKKLIVLIAVMAFFSSLVSSANPVRDPLSKPTFDIVKSSDVSLVSPVLFAASDVAVEVSSVSSRLYLSPFLIVKTETVTFLKDKYPRPVNDSKYDDLLIRCSRYTDLYGRQCNTSKG